MNLAVVLAELQQMLSDKARAWKSATNEPLFSKIESIAENEGTGREINEAFSFLQLDDSLQELKIKKALMVVELKFKLAGERASLTVPIS